jgi:uncharacterized protein
VRFLCDVMLGKLARYLRLLGLDAVYLRDLSALKSMSQTEEPFVFITRRTKPVGDVPVVVLHSELTRQQLGELKGFLKPLIDPSKVLNRCIECNVLLEHADKDDVEHRVPEFVFHHYRNFKRCLLCGRIYWEGSHAQHMSGLVKELLD